MSEIPSPEAPSKNGKSVRPVGRPRRDVVDRANDPTMMTEQITFRDTKKAKRAMEFTADYFNIPFAEWCRAVLFNNTIQPGKPLPVLPIPATEGERHANL